MLRLLQPEGVLSGQLRHAGLLFAEKLALACLL